MFQYKLLANNVIIVCSYFCEYQSHFLFPLHLDLSRCRQMANILEFYFAASGGS